MADPFQLALQAWPIRLDTGLHEDNQALDPGAENVIKIKQFGVVAR